tara:strand:+ start:330 stop:620 length:291 start_codon:yes stop_codon:yes gene_type:complete
MLRTMLSKADIIKIDGRLVHMGEADLHYKAGFRATTLSNSDNGATHFYRFETSDLDSATLESDHWSVPYTHNGEQLNAKVQLFTMQLNNTENVSDE